MYFPAHKSLKRIIEEIFTKSSINLRMSYEFFKSWRDVGQRNRQLPLTENADTSIPGAKILVVTNPLMGRFEWTIEWLQDSSILI